MSYQFEAGETIKSGITRIVTEQIDQAISELETADVNPGESIHSVRKRVKKLRAILRLIRSELGKKTYNQTNIRFRDLSRQISVLRDAKAQIETIDRLKQAHNSPEYSPVFASVRRKLTWQYKRLLKDTVVNPQPIASNITALIDARADVASWPLPDTSSFAPIGDNLQKLHKQSAKLFKKARKHTSDHNLHEWRKTVKYLRHSIQIIQPAWAPVLGAFDEELSQLSDLLGEHNDLHVLSHGIEQGTFAFPDSPERSAMLALLQRERQLLQGRIFPLGQRIFTEKTSDFVSRCAGYWKIWQKAESGATVHN